METRDRTDPWPQEPDRFVTSAQVAARLGYGSVKSFHNARPRLRDMGFPDPVLPRRWRAVQIDTWLDRRTYGLHAAPANDIAPAAAEPCPARRAMADERRRKSAGAR